MYLIEIPMQPLRLHIYAQNWEFPKISKMTYNFSFQLSNKDKNNIRTIKCSPLLSFSAKSGGFMSKDSKLIGRAGRIVDNIENTKKI